MKNKYTVVLTAIGASAYAGIALAPNGGIQPGQSASDYAEEVARESESENFEAEHEEPRLDAINELFEADSRRSEERARETEK